VFLRHARLKEFTMSIRITKYRGPALGLTLAAALAALTPAYAAERSASKQENIGVASGFAVGAAAGGPVGAIIGAAAGALMGDRYHKKEVERTALKSTLSVSESERGKLKSELAQTQSHGEKLGQAIDRTRDLETEVSFRTADTKLSDVTVARLQKLGSLASSLPDTKVRVSGYADPRGSEAVNAALSEKRAAAVAQVLESAGVDSGRLIVESHGETQSSTAEGDVDGYAFDRKVTVRIEREVGGVVANR
jgi:outer membrane protein OmpA-like peptidoglycan-associated protein